MSFLGIDIGTSACKALVLSPEGQVLADCSAEYGILQPKPGWTEQDPACWIEAVRHAINGIVQQFPAEGIQAIGLSGQMHGLTPIDADGQTIRPAILWNDQRNGSEALKVEDLAGGTEAMLELTGNRMLIGYTGGKILWMRKHEPMLFARVAHALNPKDYLRLVMTGEYATEVSDASGTGLFDVRRRCWADELIDRLDFDRSILPVCHESDIVSGTVSRQGARLFGLIAGTPVIGGAGDAVAQTLGSGVARPGTLQTTIGTAGIAACALQSPAENPGARLQVFCNAAPNLWHCMGVSMNAGGALAWLRSTLDSHASYDAMTRAAGEVPAGAGGLIFLPYLNGERCPHPDPLARGAFVGLTARHDQRHMIRAVLESAVYSLFDMYQIMQKMGQQGDLVITSGGGSQSQLWRQIQAGLFDCPVVTAEGAAEGGAFGAALLAGISQKAWNHVEEAAQCCHELTRDDPIPADVGIYRQTYQIYTRLYGSLSDHFHALTELEQGH
ncbi:MAG: xylulokinase [Rhodobacteraceae bacterium]|nr:xylulokinase [Paracoccaceae bacterium]